LQIPGKTAEYLRKSGFYTAFDLRRIDRDGYLHIAGRNKYLMISGDLSIYAKHTEMLVTVELGVLQSAVSGIPNPDFGNLLWMFW